MFKKKDSEPEPVTALDRALHFAMKAEHSGQFPQLGFVYAELAQFWLRVAELEKAGWQLPAA